MTEITQFNAIQQIPNLRSGLVDTLSAQIETGDLAPGQRLPTEQAIMKATGVSRTVVREALAALRARGLIVTRQGLGAFVANDPTRKSFSILQADVDSIDAIISVLELRIGIEVEAAGYAALRRDDEDIERMQDRLGALTAAVESGNVAADDAAFHRSVLVATHNLHYARLFDTLGAQVLPSQWTHYKAMPDAERRRHVARTQAEHRAIFDSIVSGDEKAARKVMRQHLSRSHARFTALRDSTQSLRALET